MKASTKEVTFDEMAQLAFVEPISKDEARFVWYSGLELRAVRAEMFQSLKDLQLGEFDATQYCARGLESFIAHGNPSKTQRIEAIRMVLSVQEEQRCTGERDPRALRIMSTMVSRAARERAQKLALEDEADAMALQQNEFAPSDSSPSSSSGQLKRKSLVGEEDQKKRDTFGAKQIQFRRRQSRARAA